MIRSKAFVVGLAFALSAPLGALAQTPAASFGGDWALTLDTPQGANTVNVTFTQTGEKVTGTLQGPMGTVPLEGTASGSDLKATANIDIQGVSLQMVFSGKLANDALNGAVKVGDFGEFPFTGKRAPQAAGVAASSASATTAVAATVGGGAAGKWNIVLSIQGAGEFPMSATFAQDGDKITGTLTSQAGDVPVSGTMTGTDLALKFTAQTPQGTIPVTMTGTLSATGFAGKASIEGLGEADWKGTRAQ